MTVIVLIILASITTYSGVNSVRNAKFTKFKTNLEIMQSQVNLLSEKYKEKIEEAERNGTQFTEVGDAPTDLCTNEDKVIKFLQDVKNNYDSTISIESTDYRYFDENLLKEIGMENTDTEFLVDLKNRIAIATQPIKYEGKLYYTINQIKQAPTTGGLVRTENVTVENVTYNKTNTGYKITLENVQCSKYVAKYDVQYKEVNDSTYKTADTGITEKDYSFNVDKYGLYYIKVTDAAGKTTVREDIVVSIYNGVKFSRETKVKMVKSITDDSVTVEDVTIPAGFTISGLDSECAKTVLGVDSANKIEYTIDDGVVIYLNPSVDWTSSTSVDTAQKEYDQFVWVPVPNAVLDLSEDTTGILLSEDSIKSAVQSEINEGRYPMAIKKDETNYFGVLYQFSLDGNAVKVEPHSTWAPLTTAGNREPSAVTGYDTSSNLPQVNGILNTSYSDSTSFGSALQADFNAMANKVVSKKGFWVGRYETSGMSNSTTETYASSNEKKVNVVKGTTTGISGVTWYRMYAQQKIYSKLALGSGTVATSSMIWGSQWDQIMIWMKGVRNTNKNSYYVINALTMGNYGGSDDSDTNTYAPAPTGNSESYKVKNVYDLAGNVDDWSLEANGTNLRVLRGGLYNHTNSSYTRADSRVSNVPDYSSTNNGSRASLY